MRITGSWVAVAAVIAATWARAQVPSRVEPSREVQGRTPPRADADVVGLLRFEPTGLSLLRPYRRRPDSRGPDPRIVVEPVILGPDDRGTGGRCGPPRTVSVLDLQLFDGRSAAVFGLLAAPRP